MKTCLTVVLLTIALDASAEPTSFPEGLSPIAAGELSDFLKDKVFVTIRSDGVAIRMNFKSDGKFEIFFNKTGFNSKEFGTWSAEDGKLCVDDPVNGKACNEIRAQGQTLYYKRNKNGEILTLSAQGR